MSRPPKPWYRKDRDAWFAQVDGVQRPLAKGKGARKDAEAALHQLMAERAKPKPESPAEGGLSVRSLLNAFLDHADRNTSPATYEFYKRHLVRFGKAQGDVRAADVRPHHVTEWVYSLDVGQTTAHGAVTAVKRAFNWARKEGLIPSNPIQDMEKPTPKQRETIPDREVFDRFFAGISDANFHELMSTIFHTGCRLGEAIRVTAAQFSARQKTWTMLGKTSRRTKRKRIIVLTDEVVAVCRKRAKAWPTGPLFRNEDGNPWTRHAVAWRIKRIRDRIGLPADVCSHALRHLFATDALDNDVPIATVSELLGHVDTTMVSRTYSHLSDRRGHLRSKLETIRGSGAKARGPGAAGIPPASSVEQGASASAPAGRPRRTRPGPPE